MADVVFNCLGNNYAGVPIFTTSISGNILSPSFSVPDGALNFITSVKGNYVQSALVDADVLAFVTSIKGDAVANSTKSNWVGWSKIGQANFALDLTNDAGFRPMDWSGFVYQVKKLGNAAIVYGSGGVTIMNPVSSPFATFGFKEVINIGIKSKLSIAGDEFVHFFIDKLGWLYKLTKEGLDILGYEEFLEPLVNPILVWDPSDRRLYIGDSSHGYIYNDSALGGGYSGLTGIYRVNNSLTLISPEEITIDPFSFCTDTLDFKYRGMKSIEAIQFDIESTGDIYAAIDYRYKKSEVFKTTRWTKLNASGIAHLRTAGVEFRIRLKSLVRLNFKLSYINIQFKIIDRRFSRGSIGETPDAYVN